MLIKCRFHYKLPFFSCNDINYVELVKLIKQYFKEYNACVASTTIEGILINKNNYDIFWKFIKSTKGNSPSFQDVEVLYNSFFTEDKINFLRLLYNGKTDYILNIKQLKKSNPKLSNDIINAISNNYSKKTDGWMSKWLKYYLCNIIRVDPNDKKSFIEFNKKIHDISILNKLVKSFKNDFEEMYEIIQRLNQLSQKETLM